MLKKFILFTVFLLFTDIPRTAYEVGSVHVLFPCFSVFLDLFNLFLTSPSPPPTSNWLSICDILAYSSFCKLALLSLGK